MQKYSVNDNYFNNLNNEKAWLLGLLASDGYVRSNNKRFGIGQSGIKGLNLIKYVKNILHFTGNILQRKPKNGNIHYYIEITSPKLVSKLNEYNIVHKKTLIYKFPEKIIPYLYSFLRGYIDGDGCLKIIDANGGNNKYLFMNVIGTKKFIDRCDELIEIKGNKDKDKNCKNLWRLAWNGFKAIELGKIIFYDDTIYSYYKKSVFLKALKIHSNTRTEINKIKKEKMVKLFKEGKKLKEVSDILKIDRGTIADWKKLLIK